MWDLWERKRRFVVLKEKLEYALSLTGKTKSQVTLCINSKVVNHGFLESFLSVFVPITKDNSTNRTFFSPKSTSKRSSFPFWCHRRTSTSSGQAFKTSQRWIASNRAKKRSKNRKTRTNEKARGKSTAQWMLLYRMKTCLYTVNILRDSGTLTRENQQDRTMETTEKRERDQKRKNGATCYAQRAFKVVSSVRRTFASVNILGAIDIVLILSESPGLVQSKRVASRRRMLKHTRALTFDARGYRETLVDARNIAFELQRIALVYGYRWMRVLTNCHTDEYVKPINYVYTPVHQSIWRLTTANFYVHTVRVT